MPRVVARINNPKNEWMFNEMWGVDVSVSTPAPAHRPRRGGGVGRHPRAAALASRAARPGSSRSPWRPTRRRPTRTSLDLGFPRDSTVVAILRKDHVVVPRGRHPGAGRRRGARPRHRGERGARSASSSSAELSRGVDPQAAARRPAAGVGRRVATGGSSRSSPWPIFASDAISSTAYATEEILHVLVPIAADGGPRVPDPDLASWSWCCWPSSCTSYRQTIFAYPERRRLLRGVARTTSARSRRSSPARRCWSTTCSPWRCRSRPASPPSPRPFPELRDHRVAALPRLHRAPHAGQPARPEGVGHGLRRPDLRLHRARSAGLIGYGLYRVVLRRPRRRCRRSRSATTSSPTNGAAASPASPPTPSCGPSPPAPSPSPASRPSPTACRRSASPSRRNAAITLVWMGAILGGCFFGISVLAHRLQPTLQRGRDDPLDHRPAPCSATASFLYFVLQAATAGDPAARRQHRVRRLPADRLDPRPRRLPAPPAPQPGRPAGVLQRHHRPVGRRRSPHRRLRRRHHRPDPALRGRRVLRLHAWRSTAWCRHHQRHREHGLAAPAASSTRRRHRHRHRPRGRRRLEVHDRRLDPGGR